MRLLFLMLSVFGLLFAEPLKVDVKARAAMLMNADTGAILYEKKGYVQAYPGSTTKIATALLVLEEKKIDLNAKISISAEAVKFNPGKRTDDVPSHWLETDGSMMGIARSEVISLDALMHGLMLVSGNDAANAIAEASSGSIPQFMDELNAYVQKVGCLNTHFMNPHGYHHSNHKTTPYDLCVLMKRGLQHPKFVEIIRKTNYVRPKTNKLPAKELKQSNYLINPEKKSYYPKAIGGKTGHHDQAGWCLVSAAEHEGRKLIACVLGCPKLSDRFEDSKKLYEAAFSEKRVEKVLVPNYQCFEKELLGAKTLLKATLRNGISMTFFPAEEPHVKAFVHWDAPSFPIHKGDSVGEVRIQNECGEMVLSENLIATEDVSATFGYSIKQFFHRFF